MIRRILLILVACLFLSACAETGYNMQKGAAIGAGLGALAGQAIGNRTAPTLIGMAAGTLAGAIAGNAVDQQVAKCRQATQVSQAQASAAPENEAPPGEWVVVPGKWVEGNWVPAHRVWVPINP